MSDAKSLNCPNCGTPLTQPADERFCRACGLDLLTAAEKLNSVMVPSAPKKKNGSAAFMITITVIALVMAGCSKLFVKTSPASSNIPILPTQTHAQWTPPITSTIPWTPPASSTPIPTQPLSDTPTATSQPCYRWDQVTKEMTGQTVCMYGIITDFIQAPGAATRYRFSSKPNTFFLFSKDTEILDPRTGKTLAPGACIQATAPIHFNGAPYIDLGDLVGPHINAVYTKMNSIFFYDSPARCQVPSSGTTD
jgi:hypothetical protein